MSSWRESTVSAVHLHTVRTCADEEQERPSIILIKCMFVFYSLFAFLGLFCSGIYLIVTCLLKGSINSNATYSWWLEAHASTITKLLPNLSVVVFVFFYFRLMVDMVWKKRSLGLTLN